MPFRKLPNYLRTFRKRAGLSEVEIAFLLGLHDTSHVSRYEHFRSNPGLDTTLAYHVIFQTSPPELFGGRYQKAERAVRRRAKRLLGRLVKTPPNARGLRKLVLLRILAGQPEPPKKP